MHDIKRLEERWLKYQHKRRKPYYITIIFLFALAGLLYLINTFNPKFSFLKETNMTSLIMKSTSNQLISQDEKPFLYNKPILTIQNVKRVIKDTPLIPTVEQIDAPLLPVVENIPVIEKTHTKKFLKEKYKKKIKAVQHQKKHLKIIKVASKSAYAEVEKRFGQFHDVNDALFLARVYYSNGAYEKAEKWALKTNKLNNVLEESWIIFAKSKIKLGHIDEAKHILLTYIKKSNSQKAKNLLYKISK